MSRKWIYGRNIILTGCSTGIGKELTLQLVKEYNCNVMGVARNKQKLEDLKNELGNKFTYRQFDVGSKESWEMFVEDLENIGFQPDIIINNAGVIQPFTAFADLEESQINKVIVTNFDSLIYSSRVMIPVIKKSKYGGIVNVASASAILPVAGQSIYSATKSADKALTEAIGQELRGFGIYVSCIMPGPVKTDLYKARESDGDKGAKVKDNLVENIGMTATKAAKKIISVMKRKKVRCALGPWAKFMDLGMKVAPRLTPIITGKVMKFASRKIVASFAPIFEEQENKKVEIKALKIERKKITYNKNTVPTFNGFDKDEPKEFKVKK